MAKGRLAMITTLCSTTKPPPSKRVAATVPEMSPKKIRFLSSPLEVRLSITSSPELNEVTEKASKSMIPSRELKKLSGNWSSMTKSAVARF